MPGRTPKPTALKKLQGNPGKRPIDDSREPKPKKKKPYCPSHLSKEAKAEWRRIVNTLFETGLLTELDRTSLAMYCEAYGRWIRAEKEVQKRGEIVKTKNGNIIQNPYLSVANRAYDQLSKMIAQFGLSPAARTRIKVDPEYEQLSIADLLFGDIEK